MTLRIIGLSALLLVAAAASAAPHTITHSPISVAPGTNVSIGGTNFVLIQVPVRQFTVDKRYAVRFLTPAEVDPLTQETVVFGFVDAEHNTDALTDQNATVDGFDASITVRDSRRYGVQSDVDFQTQQLTNRLKVHADALAIVRVKLGDTVLTFFADLSKLDQDADLGAGSFNGSAQSAWGRYVDPTGLITQGNGLDKWIDYIRIIPLN